MLIFHQINQYQAIIADYFDFRHHDSSNYQNIIYFDFSIFIFQFANFIEFFGHIRAYIARISSKSGLFRGFSTISRIFHRFTHFHILDDFPGFSGFSSNISLEVAFRRFYEHHLMLANLAAIISPSAIISGILVANRNSAYEAFYSWIIIFSLKYQADNIFIIINNFQAHILARQNLSSS